MKSAPFIGVLGGGAALLLGVAESLSQPFGWMPVGAILLPLAALWGTWLAAAHPHRAAGLMGGAAALLARLHEPAPLVTAAVALLGLAAVLTLADRTQWRGTPS